MAVVVSALAGGVRAGLLAAAGAAAITAYFFYLLLNVQKATAERPRLLPYS